MPTRLPPNCGSPAREFNVSLPNATEAVAQALPRQTRTPVVLVDTGDNVGGGSAGDGTVILTELLGKKATGAVVCLYAPEEVPPCAAAEAGRQVSLRVGGKVDRLHGDPVTVAGRVALLHDGTYVEEQVRHGGKRVNHMGATALVELPADPAGADLAPHPPFSLGPLTCLDVLPERQRILVVKAAIAYKAAYSPVAGSVVQVELQA